MMENITFLYPYSFGIVLFYLFCIFVCKPKNRTIYFSNIKMLKESAKYQGVALKILRFFVVFFIAFALATPVKKEYVSFKEYDPHLIHKKLESEKESIKDFVVVRYRYYYEYPLDVAVGLSFLLLVISRKIS